MEVDSGEKESAVAILLLGCALKLNESQSSKCRRKRRIWVKPWLLNRQKSGIYHNLVNELVLADRGDYRRFMRMNTETFEVIVFLWLCLNEDLFPRPFL